MRNRQHYEDMLARNPNATVGLLLAARMVAAAKGINVDSGENHDRIGAIARNLRQSYGDVLSHDQVVKEMRLAGIP